MRRVMLLGAVVFTSRVLPAQQVDTHSIPAKSRYSLESFVGKKPLTRAERTNFTETSHYDDVIVFIDSLKKLGAKISTGSIAKASIWEVTRVNIWFIATLVTVLLLVTYVPVTGMGLVDLFYR